MITRPKQFALLVIVLIALSVLSLGSFLHSNNQTAQATPATINRSSAIEQLPPTTQPTIAANQKWQQQLTNQDQQTEKQQENAHQRPNKAAPRPEPAQAINALNDQEEFKKQQLAYENQRQALLAKALAAAKAANYHGQPDELPSNNINQGNTP